MSGTLAQHDYDARIRRIGAECTALCDLIEPTRDDWGPNADLFDYIDSVRTLLTFAHAFTGLDHAYDPDNTTCDECMNYALSHGHA